MERLGFLFKGRGKLSAASCYLLEERGEEGGDERGGGMGGGEDRGEGIV